MTKKNKVVKVKVKKDGIDVNPDAVRIDFSDTLCWEGEDGSRFEIEFDGDSPFDRTRFGHTEASTPRALRPQADRKGYKYTVYEEGNRKNMKDPKVIVEDPT